MNILVSGGCGFIGSHFIRAALKQHKRWRIINVDKLSYAGNLANTEDFSGNPNYQFVKGDICDLTVILPLMKEAEIVVHFAAETHVDRSIMDPDAFLQTNIIGTYRLLCSAVKYPVKKFIHISTDEVYGSIEEGAFKETDAHNPSSPYAASKDAADRLAHAFFVTHKVPAVIARPANTYGPFQYPEKVMPLFITNLLEGKKVPLYGDGMHKRDWLYVEDHIGAILLLLEKGAPGEAYNIPGNGELTNLEMTKKMLLHFARDISCIEHVKDRKGHDRRYALDGTKIMDLGWKPAHSFDEGLSKTISWYKANVQWWQAIKSGEYRNYYEAQYKNR